MWVDEENKQDPYNRTSPMAGTPTVGAGGGVSSAPVTSTGTTSNPSTQNPINTNQPTQNFGTVQDYLKGNQQQGEALGQQFTGNLATTQTNEKGAIDTAAKQTQSDINAGMTNYDAGLVSKAVSDPTKITGNPDQLSSFLKQWNAAYTGPSSFENSANYAPASAAASEASSLGMQESTTGGQQQLLHDQFGVYGQGNQGLDQALLQGSSYFPKVQEQAKQFGTVQDYLTQQATPINEAAKTAATNTAATKTNTQNAFANNMANFQSDLAKKVNTDQGTATKIADVINSQSQQHGRVDPAETAFELKAVYNLPPDIINSVVDYIKQNNARVPNPGQYTYNPALITPETAASAQDYANAAAYSQLTGQDYSGVLNPANASKANTWMLPTANFSEGGEVPPSIHDYLKKQKR